MFASIKEVSNSSYDYIIVGGGTSGLTIAARLAEIPDLRIIVLEVGEARIGDPLIDVPGQLGKQFGNPDYDWNYKTVPQEHADSRSFIWPNGRVLGGNSAINFFVWSKPPKQDIDAWEALGNPGWNWSRFSEAIKKVETLSAPEADVATKNRQTHKIDGINQGAGPLHASFTPVIMDQELVFQDALLHAGVKLAKDPFYGDPIGTHMCACSMDSQSFTRSYAVPAFFLPNRMKPNLHVLCKALVESIKFRERSTTDDLITANGVEFEYEGQRHTVLAKKEVILCCGAVKSPQLLELSGIGDKSLLSPLGIKTVVDLPGVGTNLQEHVYGGIVYEMGGTSRVKPMDHVVDQDSNINSSELNQQASRMCLSGISFLPLRSIMNAKEFDAIASRFGQKYNEINAKPIVPGMKEQWDARLQNFLDKESGNCEILFFPLYYGGRPDLDKDKTFASVLYLLNHPLSRGTIHISSTDPHTQPEIDPHYFEEDLDLDILKHMIEFIRSLRQYPPLKEAFVKEVLPGADCTSEEDIKRFIKNTVSTTYHAAGTCSMLPRKMNGVVDPNLRVYGTTNLRIADLSIVPLHVASHTQTVAYAIAQQAAEIILGITEEV